MFYRSDPQYRESVDLVESYDQEQEARNALAQIVRLDPESAGEYALLTYDANGAPVDDPIIGSDLGILA